MSCAFTDGLIQSRKPAMLNESQREKTCFMHIHVYVNKKPTVSTDSDQHSCLNSKISVYLLHAIFEDSCYPLKRTRPFSVGILTSGFLTSGFKLNGNVIVIRSLVLYITLARSVNKIQNMPLREKTKKRLRKNTCPG